MDKRLRITIIIGCIVTFIIVPVVATLIFSANQNPQPSPDQSQQQPTDRSVDDIKKAIIKKQPDLADTNNIPLFTVVSVNKPAAGWYIATIRTNDDPEGLNPAKVLLHDSGGQIGLEVLLGPGTSFPKDVTEPLGIPGSVVEELNK